MYWLWWYNKLINEWLNRSLTCGNHVTGWLRVEGWARPHQCSIVTKLPWIGMVARTKGSKCKGKTTCPWLLYHLCDSIPQPNANLDTISYLPLCASNNGVRIETTTCKPMLPWSVGWSLGHGFHYLN